MHLGQHRIAAADRQQRQRREHAGQLEVGVHVDAPRGTVSRPRPEQRSAARRSAASAEAATAGDRSARTPQRRARPAHAGQALPARSGSTIARVSATAAAEAPCRTPLTAGTLLEAEVQERHHQDDDHRQKAQPNSAASTPAKAAHLAAGEDRHVHLIRAGQDPAHRHRATGTPLHPATASRRRAPRATTPTGRRRTKPARCG